MIIKWDNACNALAQFSERARLPVRTEKITDQTATDFSDPDLNWVMDEMR